MADQQTTIEVGQRWAPSKPKTRAGARHVLRLLDDDDGYPAVRYAEEGGGMSTMRLEGFKAWVRKMAAQVSAA